MQNILRAPAALLEKINKSGVYSGAYENFGAACRAQLIPYRMGSFAFTDLPLERRMVYI